MIKICDSILGGVVGVVCKGVYQHGFWAFQKVKLCLCVVFFNHECTKGISIIDRYVLHVHWVHIFCTCALRKKCHYHLHLEYQKEQASSTPRFVAIM